MKRPGSKSEIISVRCNRKHRKLLERAAARIGAKLPLSTWMLAVCLQAAKRAP